MLTTAPNMYNTISHKNRNWKFGGNRKNELAAIDFLFDSNIMYGSDNHCFEARNYFRFQ